MLTNHRMLSDGDRAASLFEVMYSYNVDRKKSYDAYLRPQSKRLYARRDRTPVLLCIVAFVQ